VLPCWCLRDTRPGGLLCFARNDGLKSPAWTRRGFTGKDQPRTIMRRDGLMPQTDVGRSEDLLGELAGWVKLETPTTEASAVNRLMDVAEAELARAGAVFTRSRGRDGSATT